MKKFDFVVGNPPYNETVEGRSEDPPIYHFFYDASINVGKFVSFITPSRFLFDTGKTPSKWNKKMLNSPHFKILEYEPVGSKVFPTTDIKGGVAITSWDNTKVHEPIKIFYPHSEIEDIVKKVRSIEKVFFDKIIFSNTSYKYDKLFYEENPDFKNRVSGGSKRYLSSTCFKKFPEVFTDEKLDEDNVKIVGRENYKRATKFFNKDYLNPPSNFMFYKLVLPSSNGSGDFGEILSEPFVGNPKEGYTETFVTFGNFGSFDEANNSLKYIKTKFARAMLNSKKVTQGNKNSKVWENVPNQDFTENSDIDWTKSIAEIDQQLYKKYGLSPEEIDFIEEKVQEME
ncbi:Eco57I restriction-modification methylase domain-containing protein [Anaerococcus tetradius]|uniref:Eco57I restriction endonuclease n=1 Tax=Anaerococcus tetradius ATCC 35098 TaxID=525255 RepID=C2CG71_9FIRM|nr:Eco57I restriction-modification methylase domain-containing protein [Anaerococcus tetradius]EEI83476.1 Eco57I restriction endonuclease [Anaerococcus tetradius ATCC 35098]